MLAGDRAQQAAQLTIPWLVVHAHAQLNRTHVPGYVARRFREPTRPVRPLTAPPVAVAGGDVGDVRMKTALLVVVQAVAVAHREPPLLQHRSASTALRTERWEWETLMVAPPAPTPQHHPRRRWHPDVRNMHPRRPVQLAHSPVACGMHAAVRWAAASECRTRPRRGGTSAAGACVHEVNPQSGGGSKSLLGDTTAPDQRTPEVVVYTEKVVG